MIVLGRAPDRALEPMLDALLQDGVGGQPDGVEVACLLQPRIDCGDRVGGIGTEEPHEVALGISGDDGVEDVLPAVGAVDVAGTQGALLQHPELVEQKERMVAGAAEVTVPRGSLLLPVGGAHRAVHVKHDVLQPRSVEEPVDPLSAEVGKRRAVLHGCQTLGLEPAHLRVGSGLPVDGAVADDLPHHRVMGQTICIIYILVSGQPTENRLPQQANQIMQTAATGASIAQAACQSIQG